MTELKPFQAIKYTTSSGENCVATKNNGIVTIEGDKNGVRQMKQDEFMKQFVEDQSKKTLERTPAKDTVTFSGAEKPKMSNNTKGWLVALGTLVTGAGIYALTRGKQGEDAVQRGANELSETLNNSSIKNKASEVVDDIVENADIPKPIRIIEPEIVRPNATNPININQVKPEAIEEAVIIPVDNKAMNPIKEALASTEKPSVINLEDEIVGEVAEKPAVINLGDDGIKQVDNILESIKETKMTNDDFIDNLNRMTDDLEKEAKKRREQERIDNDNMMLGAICLDDALRTSQRNIGEVTDDLSHNFGKLDDFGTPHSTDYFDNTNDILSSHSSILDDTNDFLSHNSFDDFGSSYGSSFDNLGDDMMGGMW